MTCSFNLCKGVEMMSEDVKDKYKPFSLNIEIDGKEQRFVTPKKIKGTLWREGAMVAEDIESGQLLISDLDSHLQFVCDVFGNQFSINDLEEGVDARDLMNIVYATTFFVMGQVTVASEMLTKSVDVSELDEKKS